MIGLIFGITFGIVIGVVINELTRTAELEKKVKELKASNDWLKFKESQSEEIRNSIWRGVFYDKNTDNLVVYRDLQYIGRFDE